MTLINEPQLEAEFLSFSTILKFFFTKSYDELTVLTMILKFHQYKVIQRVFIFSSLDKDVLIYLKRE